MIRLVLRSVNKNLSRRSP